MLFRHKTQMLYPKTGLFFSLWKSEGVRGLGVERVRARGDSGVREGGGTWGWRG